MTPLKLQIEELQAALPQLAGRDREFATSLIEQFLKRGLSDKQAFWVGKLLARATGAEPQPAAQKVGDLNGLIALLDVAAKHLKHPAVLVRALDRDFRLNLAGSAAKVPGSINVCSIGTYGDRDWFGRVTKDGQFEPSRKFDGATITAVAAALKAMADDPAAAAAAYGLLTGCCCFCNKPLTDERSTAVGYGPQCATHWGLPWNKGDVAKARAA
jgi:hypothetical protein